MPSYGAAETSQPRTTLKHVPDRTVANQSEPDKIMDRRRTGACKHNKEKLAIPSRFQPRVTERLLESRALAPAQITRTAEQGHMTAITQETATAPRARFTCAGNNQSQAPHLGEECKCSGLCGLVFFIIARELQRRPPRNSTTSKAAKPRDKYRRLYSAWRLPQQPSPDRKRIQRTTRIAYPASTTPQCAAEHRQRRKQIEKPITK